MRLRRAGKEQRHEERQWIPRGDIAALARTAAERGEADGDVFRPSCYRRSEWPARRPLDGERTLRPPLGCRHPKKYQSPILLNAAAVCVALFTLSFASAQIVICVYLIYSEAARRCEAATRDELQSRQ